MVSDAVQTALKKAAEWSARIADADALGASGVDGDVADGDQSNTRQRPSQRTKEALQKAKEQSRQHHACICTA